MTVFLGAWMQYTNFTSVMVTSTSTPFQDVMIIMFGLKIFIE